MKKTLLLAGSVALLSQCTNSTSSVSVDRLAELSGRATKAPREYAITLEFKDSKGKPVQAAPSTVTAKPGREAVVAIERGFKYPAAYNLAEFEGFTKKTFTGNYPVTPSTPTDFRNRNLGYQAVLKAKQQGAFIIVQGSVSHEKFIGFSRAPGEAISPIVDGSRKVLLTENRVDLPNFVRSETPVFIAGLPGVPQVIDLPGVPGSLTVTVIPVE